MRLLDSQKKTHLIWFGAVREAFGRHQEDVRRRLTLLDFRVRRTHHLVVEQRKQLLVIFDFDLHRVRPRAGGQGDGNVVLVQMPDQPLGTYREGGKAALARLWLFDFGCTYGARARVI